MKDQDHVCTLPNIVESKHFIATVMNRQLDFKTIWINTFKISKTTPKTIRYTDCTAAVYAERRRHAALKYWWIIHPYSYPRFIWDVIMLVTMLIGFISIPFGVCFYVMSHDSILFDDFNYMIYSICWIDIILTLITGYHDKKQKSIHFEPSIIFKRYLISSLIPDVLSSMPWDHMTHSQRRLPGDNCNPVISLINLLPLLKLLRFGCVRSQIFELITYFNMMHFYYEMFVTTLLGLYMVFWFSCFTYMIPVLILQLRNIRPQDVKGSWLRDLEDNSTSHRFQQSLFIVVEQFVGNGYGLYMPKTDVHVALTCILMLTGKILECYILVMLIQIKEERKASKSKFQEIINQVAAYTRQKQLPRHMKQRLLEYYYYRFRNSYFREKLILSNLSEPLRQEIALQSSHRLVQNVAIFRTLPINTLRSIVKSLRFELHLPGDVIVKAGAHGDCMFFLSAGTVAVLTPTGKEICHLDDGAHFGEVALLVPDQRRVASVVAIEVCEVYRLDRKDFRKCIAVHTELFAKIEKIATDRIERAMVIEEQHKNYLMRGSMPNLNRKKTLIERM